MDQFDAAFLIIRLWLGVVITLHGVNHARNLEGTAKWFASKGFKKAELNARMSGFAEVAIGLGLALGLLTQFAIAGLVATMFVAFWSIHRFAGFFVFHRPDEGYEYVATIVAAGLALSIGGPGAASLDDALGWAGSLDGWVGAAIFLGGLAAGYLQTLVLWQRPSPDKENLDE
ncbi:MAG: DoxX family protein [Acidimicrobiia bacterium]|nr:DoxX family protein [Acidimicrobiia bacterium]